MIFRDAPLGLGECVPYAGSQSWPRLSEQFPAEDKWISAGLRSLRGPGLGCEAGRAEPDQRRTPNPAAEMSCGHRGR